ncbi:MAG: hypothetical protein LUQ26_09610, partial [Methylococcaceae bacterium]|nr:hypothetical protein [Methylococcaceae bacterium]
MPSKNLKQHRLMSMVATDPKAAKRLKIPQSVGAEFMHADKGKKFKEGGEVKKLKSIFKGKDTHSEELKEAKAIKSGKITPAQYAKGEKMEKPEKSEMKKFKDGGKVTPDKYDAEKHKTDDYPQFKKGGVVKKAEGGNLALFGSRKVSEGQGMRPPGSDEVG